MRLSGELEATYFSKLCYETCALGMGAVLWHALEESVAFNSPHNVTGPLITVSQYSPDGKEDGHTQGSRQIFGETEKLSSESL